MTLAMSTKVLAGGALVVTGGGLVAAAGIAGFVSGLLFMSWFDEQNTKSLERPGYVRYSSHRPPGATGPVTEPTEEPSP